MGDQNVLTAASAYNKGIVIASTSEIFGKASDESTEVYETSDMHIGTPQNSRWSYAAVKAINEWLVMGYHKEQNLPTMILRFFNVAGPNQSMKSGLVLPTMILNAIRNKPIEIYGDGSQVRCFMHVEDAVYVIHTLLHFMINGFSCGQIYNIGNPFNEISIEELANLVLKMTNSKSEIIFRKYDEVYPPGFQELNRRIPNMTKTINAVRVWGEFVLQRDIANIVKDMAIQIESRMV
jgi:UDP-glucose 4-epimerase